MYASDRNLLATTSALKPSDLKYTNSTKATIMEEELKKKSMLELRQILLRSGTSLPTYKLKRDYIEAILGRRMAWEIAQSKEPLLDEFGIKYEPRDPVTEAEEKQLTAIDECIKKIANSFWCSGTVKIGAKTPFITYMNGPSTEGEASAFGNILLPGSKSDLTMFHDACGPSSHGQGKETVYDETYRLAREMYPNDFAINFDPTRGQSMLELTISTFVGRPCNIKLYKLNSYAKGGFFKSHQDTPKGDTHIGTLVIALNIPFEGGEFILRRGGHDFTFDWSTPKQNPGSLNWVFFYSDVEHEILPVLSGNRLTLSYDVYGRRGNVNPLLKEVALPSVNPKSLPLYSLLSDIFNDQAFFPQGGRLVFGLEHEYPITAKGWSNVFLQYLKGSDAVLAHVFEALGLEIEVRAVYEEDYDDYVLQENGPEKIIDSRGSISKSGCFFTGSDYQIVNQDCLEDGQRLLGYLVEQEKGGRIELDKTMVWVTHPRTYTLSSIFATHGNEAVADCSYVSACIVVSISPIGHPKRPQGVQE